MIGRDVAFLGVIDYSSSKNESMNNGGARLSLDWHATSSKACHWELTSWEIEGLTLWGRQISIYGWFSDDFHCCARYVLESVYASQSKRCRWRYVNMGQAILQNGSLWILASKNNNQTGFIGRDRHIKLLRNTTLWETFRSKRAALRTSQPLHMCSLLLSRDLITIHTSRDESARKLGDTKLIISCSSACQSEEEVDQLLSSLL